jgi:hypothetical protein
MFLPRHASASALTLLDFRHPEEGTVTMLMYYVSCPPSPFHHLSCYATTAHYLSHSPNNYFVVSWFARQAHLSDVSFNSASARVAFRVPRPLQHFVKHYDHVRVSIHRFLLDSQPVFLFSTPFSSWFSTPFVSWFSTAFVSWFSYPPVPHPNPDFFPQFPSRAPLDFMSLLQTSAASFLSFELADVKDRAKFKARVAPLMPGCALNWSARAIKQNAAKQL